MPFTPQTTRVIVDEDAPTNNFVGTPGNTRVSTKAQFPKYGFDLQI